MVDCHVHSEHHDRDCNRRFGALHHSTVTRQAKPQGVHHGRICLPLIVRYSLLDHALPLTDIFRVPIAAAIQLNFFYKDSRDESLKDDLTLGYWRSLVGNQAMQCLAIFTTCLPYTKIFMEGFESGLMRLDDLRRRGEQSSRGDSRSYQLMDISRSGVDASKTSKAIQVSKSWNIQTEPAEESSPSR